MTKKDYELIADCLIEARRLLDTEPLGFDLVVNAFVERLKAENPRFNEDKFYTLIEN